MDLTDGNERDVERAVLSQLRIAASSFQNASEICIYEELGIGAVEARKYLIDRSNLCFPPTLAAFEGLTSYSYRLYKSVGFDKLHAFDLGILTLIPDKLSSGFLMSRTATYR